MSDIPANLFEALENIENSGTIKARKEAVVDLQHILRHNQNTGNIEKLGDKSFHKIFDCLFEVVRKEKANLNKSKSQTTKDSAASRLTDTAAGLRQAVEIGVKVLKLNTVKALLDHIEHTILLAPGGDFCEPLSLEYAKVLHAVFGYQPHVEHFADEWVSRVGFCIACVKKVEEQSARENGVVDFTATIDSANGLSYRSSRSAVRDNGGSQKSLSNLKMLAHEMVVCLELLTAAPNAPIEKGARAILLSITNFLKASGATSSWNYEAFAAINNVLYRTRSEDIALTEEVTSQLVRLIRNLWSTKSKSIDQMLISLTLLDPFFARALRRATSIPLRTELEGLLRVLRSEYADRDRSGLKQLSMDDLRLEIFPLGSTTHGAIMSRLFSLRCAGARAESNWLLLQTLSSVYRNLSASKQAMELSISDLEDDNELNPRSRKRQRTSDDLDELIEATLTGSPHSRICAIQMLSLLAQQKAETPARLSRIIATLSSSCTEETNNVAPWAFLALACYASPASAADPTLSALWNSVWQLASRALTNVTSCRSASYVLQVMLSLRLVPQPCIADLVQLVTSAMDLNGPCIITDATCSFLIAILKAAQQINPGTSARTAESILHWLGRTYTPSRLEDKAYAIASGTYEASDISSLVCACLNQQSHAFTAIGFRTWEEQGRAWLTCQEQQKLVSYLLLTPEVSASFNEKFDTVNSSQLLAAGALPWTSTENLVLSLLMGETTRILEVWSGFIKDRRQPSLDAFVMLCKTACITVCVACCNSFRDTHQHAELRKQATTVLKSLCDHLASSACDDVKADALITVFSSTFGGLACCRDASTITSNGEYQASACEKMVCRELAHALSRRQNAKEQNAVITSMELDDEFDSQDSRQSAVNPDVIEVTHDLTLAFSKTALRHGAALYARVIWELQAEDNPSHDSQPTSARVMQYLLQRSETSILASRDIIIALPQLGISLNSGDVNQLLALFMETPKFLTRRYAFARSEVSLGACLDVLISQIPTWTDRTDQKLYDFGLDLYGWWTDTVLRLVELSANVQKRLANLLISLGHIDPDYAKDFSKAGTPRTCLFQLLRRGHFSIQFYLADRVSSIFGDFMLSEHEIFFDDLQKNLSEDIESAEGMALRHLILSELASAWPSLLRLSVFYMFDAAGRAKISAGHAAACIASLATRLRLGSPRKLFSLFAPQLVYTWLASKEPLARLPYAAFQYDSLSELIRLNESEICAQLLLFDSKEDWSTASQALMALPGDLVKRSFPKCLAYAIGMDVSVSDGEPVIENRLQEWIGGKDQKKTLLHEAFPAVMGHLYLTLQQDDPEDKWLAKDADSSSAADALAVMKGYSASSRRLPKPLQPSFKGEEFLHRINRLNRRIRLGSTPWKASWFTLTMRMLVDGIDEALGSLHSCLMIRRLRILVCMAGDIVFQGAALEMLIHSLRPFVADTECAEDVIGVLHYLFLNGGEYLSSRPEFLRGNTILVILQMLEHSKIQHDHTTQPSQHQATVARMQEFQTWLVQYLGNTIGNKPFDEKLSKALSRLRLPGNAIVDTPEASLLLLLLDQHPNRHLCSMEDTSEALRLLSDDFQTPASVSSDCLGDDSVAAKFSSRLWQIIREAPMSKQFTSWAAQVIGRAYASNGVRSIDIMQKDSSLEEESSTAATSSNIIAKSQARIAERVTTILYSRNRLEAGLADYCLRRLCELPGAHEEETIAFAQMLPGPILQIISEGTFHYCPIRSIEKASRDRGDTVTLKQALTAPTHGPLDSWLSGVATAICQQAAEVPYASMLAPLSQSIPGIASELLPSMIHILLVKEFDTAPTLRTAVSQAASACFGERACSFHPRQRFFLRMMLYLRSQPLPKETTKADRVAWLDVDYRLAAEAASQCGMPATALMLAESAAPVHRADKRPLGRTSLSQVMPASLPDDLLMSIYQQMEEPDSYYGVPQRATLDSVLHRLDHESDGFRSLLFRSAQMDSEMRMSHELGDGDPTGMVRSLSTLNFSSLTLALMTSSLTNSAQCSDEMLNAARTLQQWDLTPPDSEITNSSTIFTALQRLSRATNLGQIQDSIKSALIDHINRARDASASGPPTHSWYGVSATLTEVSELLTSPSQAEIDSRWEIMEERTSWMRLARFEDVNPILSNRQTVFSILRQNVAIQNELHLDRKQCQVLEAKALLAVSSSAREHSRLQEALTATTSLTKLSDGFTAAGLNVDAAVKFETASVLWAAGEATASVKMLQDTLAHADFRDQAIAAGHAGLLAQLGHQLGDARLEKPEEIMSKYLKQAIHEVKNRRRDKEAGKVFYEFATFCDNELQNAGNIENFQRIVKLRQGKEQEVEAIKMAIKNAKRSGDDKTELQKSLNKAQAWLNIDSEEERRVRSSRRNYVHQSLQNYLLALRASDEHDLGVLRFFALWLENADDEEANSVALRYLKEVSSFKFVILMNQLMSRVGEEISAFQRALQDLLTRICDEHSHHSVHHLYAAFHSSFGNDAAAISRHKAAEAIYRQLKEHGKSKNLFGRLWQMNDLYKALAEAENVAPGKFKLKELRAAVRVSQALWKAQLPPITMSMPLRPSGQYEDAPQVTKFDDKVSVMSGNSAPKAITCFASDGAAYKQLFKSGDDLRQDAIMEQVFEEVSKMLRNHKTTRQRDLKVRTYKVVPLSTRSGIIEFVPNSIPLNDFLRPAHRRYHPKDILDSKARDIVGNAAKSTTEHRVKEYRKVCDQLHPVLRHFFFERFDDPDDWFLKRTAYTRTTASISILGYILGLGDRHNSNIMLDQGTGEVVHIDLGVAFESGRILPIPELVPFRLTRDITDGMGVTKTEGVFRRCCEFTLDAVRQDKGSIMTLLNVLRYDPLYSWTVSPVRAKRMQEGQETGRNGGGFEEQGSSRRQGEEAGEADRALSIVEKKLSTTLSTAATVNELIQQATDERHLATLFCGWAAYF